LEKFKEATGYEEWLDFDPEAVREGLENPDKSRIDEMLAFAEKAEREYAAEAAAYEQTPADIAEQARAVYGEPEKMTVLVVEPLKEPYVKQIDPGYKSMQAEVDGTIWNGRSSWAGTGGGSIIHSVNAVYMAVNRASG